MYTKVQQHEILSLSKKTGILTADGSDDDLIKPENLANYKILPPVLDLQSAAPLSSVSDDFEQEKQDELPGDFEVAEKILRP